MKTQLTKDQTRVRKSCLGKGNCLTLLQHSNATDFIGRRGLHPVAMRVGGKLLVFDKVAYRKAVREGQRIKDDTYCMPFYDARDCADVMGSPSSNWTSWTRVLFGIGDALKDNHPDYIVLSSKNPEHTAVREALLGTGRPVRSTPLISATAVVFYLAAQKKWPDSKRYFSVVKPLKEVLVKNNITVLGLKPEDQVLPPDDASELDDLLATANPVPAVAPLSTLAVSVEEPEPVPGTPQPAKGTPPATVAQAPVGVPGTQRLLEMDDAEFEAYQQDTLAAFAEAAARRQAAKTTEVWKSGKVVDREQWLGRPYDRKVTLAYSDGTQVTFVHPEWMGALPESQDSGRPLTEQTR
jgi:hypothetical protein